MPTLDWIGKKAVVNHHNEVPYKTLELQYTYKEGKKNFDCGESENMIIHGDNLEALKALLPKYEGKINCIYIDPPYNTGEEGWCYNDNVNAPQINKWLGETVGKEAEDLTRHDKWLCMMFPRLKMLHKLLADDGVIFISIDDNELSRLKQICEEIFGVSNFVSNISWQRTYSIRNDSKGIPVEVEHILVFSKKSGWQPNSLERTEEMDAAYKNPDGDRCPWMSGSPVAPGAATHQGMVYAIQHPFTGELLYPSSKACWRYQQNQMLEYMQGWCPYKLEDIHDEEKRAEICGVNLDKIKKNVKAILLEKTIEESAKLAKEVYDKGPFPRFYFTDGGKGGIRRKVYLDSVGGRISTNFYPFSEVGHTDEAKKELIKIFGTSPFDTPKPTRLIERIIKIVSHPNSIILDSFAGSGTTAHAVLNLNKKDGGNRKFILIEMEAYAETTTAERVKRVINGYPYKGKIEEEIYNQPLTIKNLAQASDFLEEANSIAESKKDEYDKISKPKIADNCIKVIGTKIYNEKMDGLGGDFSFYELGEPMMNENGFINENQPLRKIQEYIWYTETQSSFKKNEDEGQYHLGKYNDVSYYFFYKKNEATTLDVSFLNKEMKVKADQYVIYADNCLLSEELMKKLNIVFKKIPRDIRQF